MLLRVVINNFMSFGEETEFNMFPNPRYSKKAHHLHHAPAYELDFLRLGAIYGANAAGKSNFIKALSILQQTILSEKVPANLSNIKFRLGESHQVQPVTIGIEFIAGDTAFLYAIQLDDNLVIAEELYQSGLGKEDDQLLFERKSTRATTKIEFFSDFYKSTENEVFANVIEKNLSKPFKPILKLLAELDNDALHTISAAYDWLKSDLRIITPGTKPQNLAHIIDQNPEFHQFMRHIIQSFQLGVQDIKVEKKAAVEFFGRDDSEIFHRIYQSMDEEDADVISMTIPSGDSVSVAREDGSLVVKQLKFMHHSDLDSYSFSTVEESDGTRRLLELAPAFLSILTQKVVYLIDEIESSLHPLLIKESLKIISDKIDCMGQLIFTTHESQLLDQNIFRKDEIWFIEKDINGNSSIYSLSDFKPHHTKDIRKGYLNGRYGAVPTLGKLKDLSWLDYDTTTQ
ncbi:MAG: ATP-binding protein [Bacteroidota bacterium]